MLRHQCVVLCVGALLLFGCGGSGESSSRPTEARSSPAQPAPASPVLPTPPVALQLDDPDSFYDRPAEYPRVHIAPMRYIPISTGQQLGMRLTLPADDNGEPLPGPFPVILVQSGYNIGLMSFAAAPGGVFLGIPDSYLVRRGYAMVSVDVIGGGISQGGWELFGEKEQAGYADTVDWVKAQPWCNGDIGVAGASYMGITSLFTAQVRPQDIKAVFASVPLGDAKRGIVGTGGLLNAVFMGEWMALTHLTSTQNVPLMLLQPELMPEVMAATQEHIDHIDNYYLPLIERAIHGDAELAYDSPFWRERSPLENMDQIQAPTLIAGALNDLFQRDAPLLYESLRDQVDARLMLFDGDHLSNFMQALPGTEKTDPVLHVLLQWFDQHLRGIDSGTERIAPVTQYVKHYKPGNWQGFISADNWPHPAAQPERWYLHGDGTLTQQAPAWEEAERAMAAAPFAEYDYGKSADGGFLKLEIHPSDGSDCSLSYVHWTLGVAGITQIRPCYWDHRQLEQDALNYETATMTEDYFIAGPLQADVWMSSTTADAVLSVRVDEVLPSGRVVPITNGLLLASLRAVDESRSRYVYGEMVQPYHFLTREHEQLLEPGEVVKMQVEIFPTSVIIRAGSRLRVSISPSNQAQGVLNLVQRARVEGGVTTLYHGPEYPSSLALLSVPLSALN
ncbi:CocE/NonD family hydrolase [Ketobacter sp.]|uniref:CocE/NonD family hydrolase n=1 Tax=Ketobacter sp. TaxID=2083498 RepID=UPI0025C67063|nr:CocE/NonD family hydrolase [Ketobacter sp.]